MACIFCQIAAGEIPADIVYTDEEIIAFRDVNPLAPVHILIIPREHIVALNSLTEKDEALSGRMISVANQVARSESISEVGYRLVINCGEHGGQVVPHLHMHLLGGRNLSDRLG